MQQLQKKGTATKKPLTLSQFEYGAAGEGYWSYQHMVLQLGDCVDVLKMIFPQHDFLFLFDHSCGHDKQREDRLNAAGEGIKYSWGCSKNFYQEIPLSDK